MKPMYLHNSSCGEPAKIRRGYDRKFKSTNAHRASLPDMMQAAHDAIQGANVPIHHESALVRGVPKLRGAEVMATDLRASVSLAIAGLAAEGDTTLHRVYHLDRGYERLEEKLAACGAEIERLKG